jgi:hypothetical protein
LTRIQTPLTVGEFLFSRGYHLRNIESRRKIVKKNLLNTIFNGIAVAMGIAVIVTNIVNPLSLTAVTTLLGIGVAALAIANFRK